MSDFWQDRRVFVTGCTGLVGSWTVRALLERGAHVIGLVRDGVAGAELNRGGLAERIDVVRGSVEDFPLMERILAEYEVQTVLHLAAQTIVGIAQHSPLSTFESNIKGTWCILEAARRCGYRPDVVIASSDKAYGEHRSLPYTEEAPLLARHPYDVSKACADMIALAYHHSYNARVCVTRCGNFYGGGDLNWNRLVPGTIRSILRGQRPVLRSDGTLIRDYFYVKDGAAAYLHLAECLARQPEISGQAFNFSNELQMTALQMVELILKLMNSRLQPDIRNEASNEIPHQYLSAAKARTLLGWQPLYELESALSETIGWYRNHLGIHDTREKKAAWSMPERILITGGSGFIGACLARDQIACGAQVHLMLRPEFRNWRLRDVLDDVALHWADVRDADAVRRAVEASRPDVIYNLATHGAYPTQTDRAAIFATNMQGTLNLIDALARRDYRALVHAGSSSEYGFKNAPMREDDVLESRSDYAIGKAAGSLAVLAEAYRGKPNCVVRVFSAYGPWEEPTRLVPYVMDCCARGQNPRVTAGHQPRDFIYVDDVVALLKLAAQLPTAKGRILHAGTAVQSRVRDMIETIVATVDRRVQPQYGTAQMHPYEPKAWVASIDKTTAITGWKPRHDLKSGIAAMWHWHREIGARLAA